MSILETAIRALPKKDANYDSILAGVDKEYAGNLEALHWWTESRWTSYAQKFCGDAAEIRDFLPVELDTVADWQATLEEIVKQGFRRTLAQTDQENHQRTLRNLLIVLYHPIALDSLYFKIYSSEELPNWVLER